MGKVFAYCRVSSVDQNAERQLTEMKKQGISDKYIYVDRESGKSFNRRSYQRMVRQMEAGDLLYVLSIDRLGRNYTEIQEQWKYLVHEKGIDICILDMPLLDTRQKKDLLGTFVADLILQVLSFAAENERENIRKRQAQGIEAARARGVKFGRPEVVLPTDFELMVKSWRSKEKTVKQILAESGLSKSTFYRKIKKYQDD